MHQTLLFLTSYICVKPCVFYSTVRNQNITEAAHALCDFRKVYLIPTHTVRVCHL